MELKTKNIELINRIKRIQIVVFLKKFSWFFILSLVFYLTILLGVWNVKHVEFNESSLLNSDKNKLTESVSIFLGEIIFLIKPSDVEGKIMESNKFVKRVFLEKKIPNKFVLTIEEHTPMYATYSLEKCSLFSSEGEKVIQVCEECSDSCRDDVSIWSPVYIESTNGMESSDNLIYYEEVRDILNVLNTFGYEIMYINIENGITTLKTEDEKIFTFDISSNLDLQLSRMYLVGQKINEESIVFKSLDLRFERPVMRLK